MSLGIILVHGYTGSNLDLKPLADELTTDFGPEAVNNLSLPGHAPDQIPRFDQNLFGATILRAITLFKNQNRKIVLIGHSTGGNLILDTLARGSIAPDLLILIAVPHKIDLGYGERWLAHRTGRTPLPLIDLALMVKFINSTSLLRFPNKFPILLVHGAADHLVFSKEAQAWKEENFSGFARIVNLPEVDHDIFKSGNSPSVIDVIRRAVTDLAFNKRRDRRTIRFLQEVEPDFKDFWLITPFSKRHSVLSPCVSRAVGKKPALAPLAQNDPMIANIEITTYCNLRCRFCARSRLKKSNQHMSFSLFQNILALLPNIYKITLVGLGEPLLHPQLTEFISYAKTLKKKVGLVTNAMLLNPELSRQLLEAGLDSIAFSLDGSDADLASLVREGTDFNRLINNIKQFTHLTRVPRKISTAVFSAVSLATIANLTELITQVSQLGIDVLMLTDINFKINLKQTLWQNRNDQIEAEVKRAIVQAFAMNLPVLSVHGLEEFGLEKRYHDFLMIPPGQLYQRSQTHTWCFSPWQTIPIDVNGRVTLCDCQPDFEIGALFQTPFSQIWNGAAFQKYRAEMLSSEPPEACRICPRF